MSSEPPIALESQRWRVTTETKELSAYLEWAARLPVIRELASTAMRLLALQHAERVLEVGCGTGIFLPLLVDAVGADGQVVGLDQSEAFVEEARRRVAALPGVRVDVGDAYAMPYPDGAFDAAHCERVLLHLDHPTAALREMRRVVRSGGRVVAVEPHWSGWDGARPGTRRGRARAGRPAGPWSIATRARRACGRRVLWLRARVRRLWPRALAACRLR